MSKKLFIIGNGFDIDHKLPTKYCQFRKFFINDNTDNNPDYSICYNCDDCKHMVVPDYNTLPE